MILPRLVIFVLAAVALGGCCMSGSGCYVAKDGPLSAWDGRGTGPDAAAPPEDEAMTSEQPMTPPSKKRTARTKTGMMTEPGKPTRAEAEQMRAEQDAADQDAEAKLAKKLTICRDCMPSARDRDAAMSGSVMR
jgi:hypothetical protein